LYLLERPDRLGRLPRQVVRQPHQLDRLVVLRIFFQRLLEALDCFEVIGLLEIGHSEFVGKPFQSQLLCRKVMQLSQCLIVLSLLGKAAHFAKRRVWAGPFRFGPFRRLSLILSASSTGVSVILSCQQGPGEQLWK